MQQRALKNWIAVTAALRLDPKARQSPGAARPRIACHLRGAPTPGAVPGDHPLVASITAWESRKANKLTPWDGILVSKEAIDRAKKDLDILSPSRLAKLVECPRKYLLSCVLGIEEAGNPEDELQMSRLDQRIEAWHTKPVRLVSFAFAIPGKRAAAEHKGVFLYEYK